MVPSQTEPDHVNTKVEVLAGLSPFANIVGGICRFEAINVAMGNTRVAPYSYCVDAHAGIDADIISWEMVSMRLTAVYSTVRHDTAEGRLYDVLLRILLSRRHATGSTERSLTQVVGNTLLRCYFPLRHLQRYVAIPGPE